MAEKSERTPEDEKNLRRFADLLEKRTGNPVSVPTESEVEELLQKLVTNFGNEQKMKDLSSK